MTRPCRLLALAVGAALAIAGCADIPDSGPVARVGVGADVEDGPSFYDPPPPEPGASPFEIVQGFYKAMLVYPITTEDAADFLTVRAADTWKPSRQTIVYESEVRARRLGPGVVEARVSKVGALDEQGRYQPARPSGIQQAARLTLRLESGEWRIADPPDALYVDSYFFSRTYEPFSLYFIGPSADSIVAEPIYLPRGELPYTQQPATLLVRGVLAGPPQEWLGQLGTAFPPGTRLDGSVSISQDDVASVPLVGPILDLPPQAQRRLSSQLGWTLSQLPGLDGVRILVDGAALKVPGVSDIQDFDQWSNLDPSGLPTRGQLYGLHDGRLVQVLPRRGPDALPDSLWGVQRQGIRSFDIDVSLEQVLAVSADGTGLLSGPLYASAGRTPRTVYRDGVDLAMPVYAASIDTTSVETTDPEWLVVDRLRNGTSRLLVSGTDGVVEASMSGLEQFRVDSLLLSPDGMRFAALARPRTPTGLGAARIMTGKVRRAEDGQGVVALFDPHELVVSGHRLSDIRSVGWSDATTLAVLGRPDGGELGLFTVRIDGSELTTEWFVPETIVPAKLLTSVGADRRAYLVDDEERLWVDVDGQWLETGAIGLDALSFVG